MKKNIFFIAAIATALVGCSSNDIVEEIQEQELPMEFSPLAENATRASSATTLESYHQTFGVWTYKKPVGDEVTVMDHYKVTYNDNGSNTSDKWDYDGTNAGSQTTKYWDKNATYSFYAYAPYSSNASISNKVISIASGEYAANQNLQSWDTALNSSTFTGTGSTSTTATTDWMLATPITGYTTYASPVGEDFKHTLTKIIVILKHKDAFAQDIVVNSVSVNGVYGTGSFSGSAWTASGDSKAIAGATGTIAKTTNNNYYCMEYLVMPKDAAPTFSISYSINGEPFVVTNQAITGVTTLAANTAYTITVTIGPDPIEFDATVTDFTAATGTVTIPAE